MIHNLRTEVSEDFIEDEDRDAVDQHLAEQIDELTRLKYPSESSRHWEILGREVKRESPSSTIYVIEYSVAIAYTDPKDAYDYNDLFLDKNLTEGFSDRVEIVRHDPIPYTREQVKPMDSARITTMIFKPFLMRLHNRIIEGYWIRADAERNVER